MAIRGFKKRGRQEDDEEVEAETTVKKTKERSVSEEYSEVEMDSKPFIQLPIITPNTQENPVTIDTD